MRMKGTAVGLSLMAAFSLSLYWRPLSFSTTRLDPTCGCRPLPVFSSSSSEPSFSRAISSRSESTCSSSATQRGPGQRVVAYSIFGWEPRFWAAMKKNVDAVRAFYGQNYSVRIYHKWNKTFHPVQMKSMCKIFCTRSHVDLCDVATLGGPLSSAYPSLWRLAAMGDALVSEWHSRDSDSLVLRREADAVRQWSDSSGAVVHAMRDHPLKSGRKKVLAEILAGMIGGRIPNETVLGETRAILSTMLRHSRNSDAKTTDQRELIHHFCPWARDRVLWHDSYTCLGGLPDSPRKLTECRGDRSLVWPFPTQRHNGPNFSAPEDGSLNYVGNYVDRIGRGLSLERNGPCPIECRPKGHQDWLMC